MMHVTIPYTIDVCEVAESHMFGVHQLSFVRFDTNTISFEISSTFNMHIVTSSLTPRDRLNISNGT